MARRQKKELECYVDGGCNNRTKSGGYGSFMVFGYDEVVHAETFILDSRSSNEAEFESITKLLEYIKDYPRNNKFSWKIHSDSRLVIDTLSGFKVVRAGNLIPLYKRARELYKSLDSVVLIWIPGSEMKQILGH